jgi:hypothetical protein
MAINENNQENCKNCGTPLAPFSNFCSNCGIQIIVKEKVKLKDTKLEIPIPEFVDKITDLYHLSSIVSNFLYKGIYYTNLKINWFMIDRSESPVPFEQVISDYSDLPITERIYPEHFILERFTFDEAQALKNYLVSVQDTDALVDKIVFPVSRTVKGYRDFPAAPGVDYIRLYERKGYDLPFKVEGIYDVNQADKRVVSDDKATVISKKLGQEFRNKLKEDNKPE